MPTPPDAFYKIEQRVPRWLSWMFSKPKDNDDRRARKRSGLSARQWKKKRKADRRAQVARHLD